MGLFEHFPYTNFHSLNIQWAIEKIKELLQQGETLYSQLQDWKTDTDTELGAWKTQTLAELEAWEQSLTDALEQWKNGVVIDFGSYVDQLNNMLEQARQARDDAAASALSSAAGEIASVQAASRAETAVTSLAAISKAVTIQGETEGQSVTISDGAEGAPLSSYKISFTPVQSGSGTPSISNVRPIQGASSIEITITDGINSRNFTVPFIYQYEVTVADVTYTGSDTVLYSGVFDAAKHALLVTHVKRVLNGAENENWFAYAAQSGFYVTNPLQGRVSNANGLCNILPKAPSVAQKGFIIGVGNNTLLYFNHVYDDWGVSTVEDLREWLAARPVEIVFPLASPYLIENFHPETNLAIYGTPTTITNNYGSASVSYTVDTQKYVDTRDSEMAGSISMLADDMDNLEYRINSALTRKVNIPLNNGTPSNGNSGDVLRSNGDGTTTWTPPATPTQAEVSEAVNAWFAANPSAYVAIPDNSIDEVKLASGLKAKTIKEYVTPEMFGAIGDGIADDTAPVTMALLSGKTVNLQSVYKVTEGITLNTPVNIFSTTRGGLTGNTGDYILNIERVSGDNRDYRNYTIHGISITQSGTGNALQFTGWSDYLSQHKIINCRLFVPLTGAEGWALYLQNSLAHSVVAGCNIQGNGIYATVRDANIFTKNLIYGQGIGIRLETGSRGCLNNTIYCNTIVNHGHPAIEVHGVEHCTIDNNQIEYGGSSTMLGDGILKVTSNSRGVAQHVCIINNNFGGGTRVPCSIYLSDCENVVIDNNRLIAAAGEDIHIESSAFRTTIGPENYGIGTTSNPRPGTLLKYIIFDSGIGTKGTMRISRNGNIRYTKTCDGFVHILNLTASNTATIDTLPPLYRPQMDSYCPIYFNGGAATILIRTNGEVSVSNGTLPAGIVIPTTASFLADNYLP